VPASVLAQPAGAVAGVVVTPGSAGIPDAVVTVEGASLVAAANALGRFRIDGVAPGRPVLVVRAPGFLELHVETVEVRAGETAQVTITLQPTPNYLEHVQVTATKTALSIGDVAAQADIVDRQTIDRRGDQTLTQAVSRVPGALVSAQLGSFDSVLLRGMPRDDLEFTSTLLLIDGVPQVDSRNASRVVALTINDASSIEVVRGPNSALYGRTAIGGSVNLRTADPTPDHQFGVDFTGGQFSTVKGLAKASGPVRQWGGYYVSAASERNTGYYEATSDFLIDKSALFGKLTFVPDSKSFGFVSANRVISDDSTPTNEPIIDGQLLHVLDPRFDRLTSFNIPGPNYHQSEGRITVNYTRELASWARLVEVFGYRAVQQKFIDDGDFIGSPFDTEAHTVTMFPFNQRADEDIIYQELRFDLSPTLGTVRNTLTAGASYEWDSGTLNQDFIYTADNEDGFTINYLDPVIPSKEEWLFFVPSPRVYHLGITGLFFQYVIEPVPRLVLNGGGRYDRLDLDNQRGSAARLEKTFDAFSPKLSATVKLAGLEPTSPVAINVYGTYSQAFLPPRRPSSLTPVNAADRVEPEDVENAEVGLKGSLFGGRMSLEATYFRMSEDGVVLDTRQGPFFVPTNAGRINYKGIETGAGWTFSQKLSAYLNASFYRNRYGDFVVIEDPDNPAADVQFEGNRLPISPDSVVNWGASYTPLPAFNVSFDVKHVGSTATERTNSFFLDPYALVDVAASWTRGPLRVTLSAHNLFDEEYYWSGGSETVDPARPRQVLVTLAMLFK
jgi:iron complex outermembrane receptor protein